MKKSIQIDDRLFSVFEIMHKHKGDTWNDVIAKMCGCKDYTDFLTALSVTTTLSTHGYCSKVSRCDKTVDWVDEIENVDEFLDDLIEVNGESLGNSPTLEDFCESLRKSQKPLDEKFSKILNENIVDLF